MCNESSVVFFVLTSRVWSENIFGFDANKTVLRIGARKVHHFVDAVWKLHFVFTVLKKKIAKGFKKCVLAILAKLLQESSPSNFSLITQKVTALMWNSLSCIYC